MIPLNHIYTGLDIGNDQIKIVVAEAEGSDFYVLASTSIRSTGMKKNTIYDSKKLKEALHKALVKTEEKLSMKIREVILCVPANTAQMTMETGLVNIRTGVVRGSDVVAVLKDAAYGSYETDRELVTCLPISFTVDEEAAVADPKDEEGEKLFAKAVVATSSKSEIYPYIDLVRSLGVNITDIVYKTQADYYCVTTKELDRKMGCIINIGGDVTTIAIFNKGIMIKNSFLPVGSSSVDKDISYIYKVDLKVARELKETFALSVGRYADYNDTKEVTTKEGKKITIQQPEISEVIESRLKEILKLAKNEINHLTKREISYIIVVGGISELAGFNYLVDDVLSRNASCFNMQELGARHNKFTSALGSCKYFHRKCMLSGKDISMFKEEEQDILLEPKKKSTANETMINKFFYNFFDTN